MRNRWGGAWCIGGDFNEVLNLEEKNDNGRKTRGMRDFSEFIDNQGLRNLPLSSPKFTWSNLLENLRISKLDRFLLFRMGFSISIYER